MAIAAPANPNPWTQTTGSLETCADKRDDDRGAEMVAADGTSESLRGSVAFLGGRAAVVSPVAMRNPALDLFGPVQALGVGRGSSKVRHLRTNYPYAVPIPIY